MNAPSLIDRYSEILLDAACAHGLDRRELFAHEPAGRRRGGWTAQDLAHISVSLKKHLQDEFWGMLAGPPAAFGVFRFGCELATSCESLGDALQRFFRLYGLVTRGVRFHLRVEGERAAVVMDAPGARPCQAPFLLEWWLWLVHYIAEWLTAAEVVLTAAEFPHPSIGKPDQYLAGFGLDCRFNAQAARIVFDAAELRHPVVRTVEDVARMHTEGAIRLARPPVERSCRSLVKSLLAAHLEQSHAMPTLEELASTRGVSGQTLRRRLQAEGFSYRAVKTEVRAELARRWLARDGATVSETAVKVGFAEANGLSRAIRAWTGMTAREFRRAVGAS